MAETPPAQVTANISTPPTPLHGAASDRFEPTPTRYSTRASQRRISRDSHSTPQPEAALSSAHNTQSPGTPRSSRRKLQQPPSEPKSPQPSPKSRSTRRVQVVSPTSPGHLPSVPKASTSSNSHLSILSSTTTMGDGMMPTPVKTPKKKTTPHINAAARALFQEEAVIGEGISPRRARKGRRYNGFTLESFTAEDGDGNGRIQIFTDSRDRVPEVETQEHNPFLEKAPMANGSSTQKATRTSKRRKISGEKKMDPQVQEAIDRDDGMVYVFRGKKVYKRFDDISDEEEEEIDTEDLGLLEHTPNGTRVAQPMKPLTRKSIKPRRLFQTEQQERDREREKEEEAVTDIEDSPGPEPADEPVTHDHSLRSADKKEIGKVDKTKAPTPRTIKADHSKKGSPFDSWKRTKSVPDLASTAAPKTKKRGAPDTDAGLVPGTKRSRRD